MYSINQNDCGVDCIAAFIMFSRPEACLTAAQEIDRFFHSCGNLPTSNDSSTEMAYSRNTRRRIKHHYRSYPEKKRKDEWAFKNTILGPMAFILQYTCLAYSTPGSPPHQKKSE
jgi:hypothetical protein